ncbi:hypothetical protein Tsp_06680 [Trichinella spiralis]|nr:conserved hypothetical protein [Trichinella spiralis]XP_003380520.1 hypothetical protein Tsp_06680 [Trichinella spiralis]
MSYPLCCFVIEIVKEKETREILEREHQCRDDREVEEYSDVKQLPHKVDSCVCYVYASCMLCV